MTHEFGPAVVALHKPVFDKGHISVTLTTMRLVTEGWNGGVA